jgi:hypothetical protein
VSGVAEEAEAQPVVRDRRPAKGLKNGRRRADGLMVRIAPLFDVAPAATAVLAGQEATRSPEKHWPQAGRVVVRSSNAPCLFANLKGRPIA